MAHKTFISYKYSEAKDLRDRIIDALGDDATYYQGETSDSPNMSDLTTRTIKQKLSDMLYDTSVTIVVISPHMKKSKWIEWEIRHSLMKETRDGRTSRPNGVVGVIMKVKGGYDWFKNPLWFGDPNNNYNEDYVFDIIKNNRNNYIYSTSSDDKSYISYVEEDSFLSNPIICIETAYLQSQHVSQYIIRLNDNSY